MSGKGYIVKNETVYKAMHDEKKQKVDRLSTLPNCILIYIMTFMTTKEAVQTCILSKRWINLWKYVPTLTASNTQFQMDYIFKNFIQQVLFNRDEFSPLYNVDMEHRRYLHSQILGKLVKYAISHGVEKLRVDVSIRGYLKRVLMFHHSMFSCYSLKYLDLSLHGSMGTIVFPTILDLPELIDCRLKEVAFSSSNNHCAEPFSGCKKLSTLVIDDYILYNAEILCISGDELSTLTLQSGMITLKSCKVQISAPNLKSFTYAGQLTSWISTNQLFEHNLDFLEEATVEILSYENSSNVGYVLKSWLEKISNVKSLTLSLGTIEALALIPNLHTTKPIRFGNLKSLTVKKTVRTPVPKEVLKYLLQDSPHVEKATIIQASLTNLASCSRIPGRLCFCPRIPSQWLSTDSALFGWGKEERRKERFGLEKVSLKKLVLKVELYDNKMKQKAMKTASGLSGVESVSVDMKNKKLTLIGNTDPIDVVSKLRKWCNTEIVSVGPAKEEKNEPLKLYEPYPLYYQMRPPQYTQYHYVNSVEQDHGCVIC
ncbi:hypothetical protein VNO77_33670 [Canavalia gladiata]|uniref:HMA domain-containing protein n=1 Tax=Canavalia gladiata TaxID=3824 RepID=A0AAN9Q104_CANGL